MILEFVGFVDLGWGCFFVLVERVDGFLFGVVLCWMVVVVAIFSGGGKGFNFWGDLWQ